MAIKMKKIIGTVLTLAMLMSMTAGTAALAAEEEEPAPEAEEVQAPEADEIEEEEEPISIGEEEEGGYHIQFINSTGLDIVGISIKTEEDEQFPENMMEEDAVFQAGKTAFLNYGSAEMFGIALAEDLPEEKLQEEEEVESEELPELENFVIRQIQLTFADGTVCVLHAFPFADVALAEIFMTEEENIAFVAYVSLSTEESVVTGEAEIAIRAEEEAAAELQRQTEAAAAASYTDPYGGANNNDSCLSGALFW